MNNTNILNMTQWEDSDFVEREYFNRDSLYLDNALGAIAQDMHYLLIDRYHTGGRPLPYGMRYDGFADAGMLDTTLTTAGLSISEKCCVACPPVTALSCGVNSFAKTFQTGLTAYTIALTNLSADTEYVKSIELNISASASAVINVALIQSGKTLKTFTASKVLSAQTLKFQSEDFGSIKLTPATLVQLRITSQTDGATFSLYTSATSTEPYATVNFIETSPAVIATGQLGNIHEEYSRATLFMHCYTNESAIPDITASFLDSGGTVYPLSAVFRRASGSSGCYNFCFTGELPGSAVRLKITMVNNTNETIMLYGYSILPS